MGASVPWARYIFNFYAETKQEPLFINVDLVIEDIAIFEKSGIEINVMGSKDAIDLDGLIANGLHST